MSTDTTATNTATETAADETAATPSVVLNELSVAEEINALRNVHVFLSNFDRVPGALAAEWAQTLDAIAIVANSLISKNRQALADAVETAEATGASETEAEATKDSVQ